MVSRCSDTAVPAGSKTAISAGTCRPRCRASTESSLRQPHTPPWSSRHAGATPMVRRSRRWDCVLSPLRRKQFSLGSGMICGITLFRCWITVVDTSGGNALALGRQFARTLRRREVDSNHRFLVGRSNRDGRRTWLSRKGSGSVGEPMVRIHLPPGMSLRTSGPRGPARSESSLRE